MHFDGVKVFFVHRRRQKFAKGISQEKAKIRKKYSLRKGRVLQKYFQYSSIMKKESNCLSSLQGMEKRETFKFKISYWAKISWQCLDLTLEAFAISLLLASGSVRGKSQGQHLGRSSVFCTTAPRLCWSNTAPEARERPLILGNKYKHHIRWISNSKCKSVII